MKMLPKAMRYPRVNCTIHYNESDKLTMNKIFVTKDLCDKTIKKIEAKLYELKDSIRYFDIKAYRGDVLYFGAEEAIVDDIDDIIEMVKDAYIDIYEELSE